MVRVRREYSNDLRCRVVQKWRRGVSTYKISKELEIPRWSARTIIDHFKKNGHSEVKPRPGRRRITTVREDRRIARAVEENRFLSAMTLASQVSEDMERKVSPETIRSRIRATGLHGRSARKKPFLSKVHRRKRLRYAKKYANWTDDDWRQVLFSDEASVELHGTTGRVSVWRRPHETFDNRCVLPTFKSSRKSLMMWASCTANGVGTMHFCDESVNGEYYRHILKSNIPVTKDFLGLRGETLFVQDNAPAHRAKATAKCLKDLDLKSLDHPAHSPDLNPIENLWFIMKRELSRRPASNIEDLKVKLIDIWTSIDDKMVEKCCLSMPARLDSVIANKGGPTLY